MTAPNIHNALLRPAVLQILRAAGFSYARPIVIDTITDLAARYLLLLASSTAQNAFSTHNSCVPTVQDVRLALIEVGALRPQLSALEEAAKGEEQINGERVPFEDLRGVEGFLNWVHGPANKEIRRIAGYDDDGDVGEIAAGLDEDQDYVTALKKKHSKTGEESRYQGSVLGKDSDSQNVVIVGGPVGSISEWGAQLRSRTLSPGMAGASPATSGISSAPLTPMDAEDEFDGL